MNKPLDPHADPPVHRGGASLDTATHAMILVHGRGGGPADMLALARSFQRPNIAYLAPQAAGGSWWPRSFLAPLSENEPSLSSALRMLEVMVGTVERHGIPRERILLAGFSQGACLALEFAARKATAFAGIIGLSGALLGTRDANGPFCNAFYGFQAKRFEYRGDMAATPVLLACHACDPHIPIARVRESEIVFRQRNAKVRLEIAAGAGHEVTPSALLAVEALLSKKFDSSSETRSE